MANTDSAERLLDLIRRAASLDYLSDLHAGIYRARVREAVLSTPVGGFNAEDWREAAGYILQAEQRGVCAETLREELLRGLEQSAF